MIVLLEENTFMSGFLGSFAFHRFLTYQNDTSSIIFKYKDLNGICMFVISFSASAVSLIVIYGDVN